jgi:NADPH-dependent curcumin reductase CurA
MRGFIVFDFAARYPEGVAEIGKWLASGEVKTREHVVEGLETFPDTLLMLFNGTNYAKLVLGVAGG